MLLELVLERAAKLDVPSKVERSKTSVISVVDDLFEFTHYELLPYELTSDSWKAMMHMTNAASKVL